MYHNFKVTTLPAICGSLPSMEGNVATLIILILISKLNIDFLTLQFIFILNKV